MMGLFLALLLAQDPPYTEFYEQRLRLRLDADAPATVEALPLLDGADWAVSSRWDDNIYTDLKMRDVLERHGYRGTFYLNGRDAPYYGPAYGLVEPKDAPGIDRRLLAGGNSIGGHSWTHAYVPYCNKRRIFEEILRVRIDREASSGSPVCSYAFSFTSKRNDLDGLSSRDDIVEALRRAGYHHVANGDFRRDHEPGMSVSWLLPHDGRPIDEAFEKLLADPARQKTDPNISFNMHVWYTTPEAWEKFEAQLAKYARRPGWWYCNQNEYAAYRRQFRAATLTATRNGSALDILLRRPCLLDLGDPVPLSIEVRGAGVVSAELDGVALAAQGGKLRLPHGPSQRLPAKIGWIDTEGTDGALRASLRYRDGALDLTVDGDVPLQDVRVLYRLPLECSDGVVVRRPAWPIRDRLPLTRSRGDAKYASGSAFYAAQIDFAGGRLHVTTHAADPLADPSYPRGRFLLAGPLPDAGRLPDVEGLAWRAVDPAAADFLDVEVVPTSLSWRYGGEAPVWYLAKAVVESGEERQVGVVIDRTSVKALFVNGERVDGPSARLRKGDNRLLLASRIADKFRPENAGAFFRLTEDGRRVATLRYRPE